MTGSDKTQQKLIDSIRKTKSAAAKSPEAAQSAEPAKRAAPPRSTPVSQGSDPYQSGRRVWPD
jgi:hypothetical protein